MKRIDENYSNALITEIRDKTTTKDILRKYLFLLRERIGQEIIGDKFTSQKKY